MKIINLLLIVITTFISTKVSLAQHVQATSINLNATSNYGGDYPTDNANYNNVLSIGGVGAECGLKIYKQNAGKGATFLGNAYWYDSYVFEMTDSNNSDPDGGVIFGATGNDDVFEPVMLLRGNGAIRIGSNYKAGSLTVCGAINATSVTITNPATADFVFEEDYKLKPLNEVEHFIEKNKHLPDVPSAKQMQKEGTDLATMNQLLLQKVEELTLYLIEQQKIIESQNHRLEKLEAGE